MAEISPKLIADLLELPDVQIDDVIINDQGEVYIYVHSTTEECTCPKCGRTLHKECSAKHEIKLRHLPIFGHITYIIIKPRRYECEHCATTVTQKLDWYEQRHSCTNAYEKYILLLLINSTIKDVSFKENIGYDVIEGILDRSVDTTIDWETIDKIDVIGIDEIAIKKGHKDFIVIITAFVNGELRIIAVLKDRKKETVKEFFLTIPKRLRKKVKAICSDLYVGFINAAKEVFGKKIRVIADRFHVAKLYRNSLETLRKKEMKRLKEELPKAEYKKLVNVMWILRKAQDDLIEEEKQVLRLLFKYSPDLKLAYSFSFELTTIFNSEISQGCAKRRIKGWIRRVKNSGLSCFNTFINTLSEHIEEVTNYFVDRLTSGFVEGFNNKIKVIKRRCYGFTNIDRIFKRIWLDLEYYRYKK